MNTINKQPYTVVNVKANDDYTLLVDFIYGEKKKYDMSHLIKIGKIFEPLRDINFFKKAKVKYGAVVWNDEIDIAPEELYENGVLV